MILYKFFLGLCVARMVNRELSKEQTLQNGCGSVLLSSCHVPYLVLALKLHSHKVLGVQF